MPRMIDLIRASAVPANLMQSAARGALSVPAGRNVGNSRLSWPHRTKFSVIKRLSLLRDGMKLHPREAAGNPNTPKEVLDYLAAPQNFRPPLLPALLGNPAIGEESLSFLAASISRDLVDAMLKNDRIMQSKLILASLASNPESFWNSIECCRRKTSFIQVSSRSAAGESAMEPSLK